MKAYFEVERLKFYGPNSCDFEAVNFWNPFKVLMIKLTIIYSDIRQEMNAHLHIIPSCYSYSWIGKLAALKSQNFAGKSLNVQLKNGMSHSVFIRFQLGLKIKVYSLFKTKEILKIKLKAFVLSLIKRQFLLNIQNILYTNVFFFIFRKIYWGH